MPILANVLLDAPKKGKDSRLILSATDLEVGVRSQHPADVSSPRRPDRLGEEALRNRPRAPGREDRARGDDQLVSRDPLQPQSIHPRRHPPAEEYPTLPEFSPEKTVPMPAAILSAMIESTMYAASVDETRYNLNGVYFEVLGDQGDIRMVATDGHRLACVDRKIEGDASALTSGVIIPRKGLGELKRLVDEVDAEEIELAFGSQSGLARKGDVTLVMRLIEGEFPNYGQVIPKEPGRHLVLSSEALVQSVRRVALLSSERSRAVKLELGQGQLIISSNNPDLGDAREELDVDYAGDSLTVGFNARYLLDAVSAIRTKEVRLSFHDELSPCRITPPEDESSLAVVMPMRI
jgi:DNA polymerase-3 subunit beta